MAEIEQLPIPEAVAAARRKREMARIWIADGHQIATLSANLWDDPGAWGLMLVDLAKHVAKAYEAKGYAASDALDRIRLAMEAEWSHPTDPDPH